MKHLLALLIGSVLACLLGCNLAKDTADTGERGAQGATGLAEKMKGGTVGDVNEDTGESAESDAAGE